MIIVGTKETPTLDRDYRINLVNTLKEVIPTYCDALDAMFLTDPSHYSLEMAQHLGLLKRSIEDEFGSTLVRRVEANIIKFLAPLMFCVDVSPSSKNRWTMYCSLRPEKAMKGEYRRMVQIRALFLSAGGRREYTHKSLHFKP